MLFTGVRRCSFTRLLAAGTVLNLYLSVRAGAAPQGLQVSVSNSSIKVRHGAPVPVTLFPVSNTSDFNSDSSYDDVG